MEWLIILALGVWVWWQDRRGAALTRRIDALERRLNEALARIPAASTLFRPEPQPEPVREAPTPPADEPLLLDTPLPEASNDSGEAPVREPVLLLTEVVPPDTDEPPVPFPPAAATPPPRVRVREGKFEQWLTESGLAWLAGAVVAVASVFAVSVAVRQPWFTPQVQLVCALLFGIAILGASELTRRLSHLRRPRHPLLAVIAAGARPLIAALLAGAGVVWLYAATWAAHGLYELIGWGAAAAGLTLCAAVLMGLSLLHGQALGVLAVGIGLLVPVLARGPLWPTDALTLYVCAVATAGFALAAFRRWAWVSAAALAGVYFWFFAAIAADEVRRALMLASFAALGGVLLALRKPLPEEEADQFTWKRAHDALPTIAICVSSVLLVWTWMLIAPVRQTLLAGPAWVSAMFVVLAAAAVRLRAAPAPALAVSIAALVAGFLLYLITRGRPIGDDFYPFALFASIVIIASALGAQPHRRARLLVAAFAAGGAGVLTAVAATTRADWHGVSAWTPLFTGAGALFIAAWLAARSAHEPRTDKALGAWIIGAAALLMLGVESAFPAAMRTSAHAAVAALLAAGFFWRRWSMLRYVALTAAALAVAHALSPALIGAALDGTMPIARALITLGVSAALLFAASRVAGRAEPNAATSEGLGAASAIVVLTGLFLFLRWIAAGGAGAPLDTLTEASLRALTLLAAGHVLLPRQGQQTGFIGAWRGHVLMGLGLLYVLLLPVITLNPWWGAYPEQIGGPLVLDKLALAFAAPAALALAAANRLYARQRIAARLYGGAGGALMLMWAALMLRRAFHGADMAQGDVGLFEGACYALLFLAAALTVVIVAQMRAAKGAERPFTHDLVSISRGAAWVGIVAAGLILLVSRHPWWGAHDAGATDTGSTLLAVLAQAVAAGLALVLGRALPRSPGPAPARFAAASAAAVLAWSFGHAAIRWLYHRGSMDDGGALIGLEGFAHALWPLAFVVAASALSARAPQRDSLRPYVGDLQAIWASAAWPALAFAALGLWLMFNPWWGLFPADGSPPLNALAIVAAFALAAWLSLASARTARLRWPDWFARAATVAGVGHLFFAVTFAVRRVFHASAISTAPVTGVEQWMYALAWAVFGALVFWVGMGRGEVLRRWIGLFILVGTTAYVLMLAFTRPALLIQVAAMLGVAVMLFAVTWFARANRGGATQGPINVFGLKPGARRDRRHGRRQRSP